MLGCFLLPADFKPGQGKAFPGKARLGRQAFQPVRRTLWRKGCVAPCLASYARGFACKIHFLQERARLLMGTGTMDLKTLLKNHAAQAHERKPAKAGTRLHKERPGIVRSLAQKVAYRGDDIFKAGVVQILLALLLVLKARPFREGKLVQNIGCSDKQGLLPLFQHGLTGAQGLQDRGLDKVNIPRLNAFFTGQAHKQIPANMEGMASTVASHKLQPFLPPCRIGKPQGQGHGQGP